jgi:PAS domain S-box-containing protein
MSPGVEQIILQADAASDAFGFLGDSAMARLIASHDWAATSIGPIARWPASLRMALGMIIRSPVAIVLLWGEQGILIYNDSYSGFAGQRHPMILGIPAVDAFPEVADFNRRVLDVCLGGGTLSFKDQRLTLFRNGAPEDVWMDLDYSPLLDDSGRPAGVFAVVVETTARNLADERLRIAQEAGRFGTFEWYPQTHRLVVSDVYRQIYGLPAGEEVTDDNLLDLVDPEDRHLGGRVRFGQPGNPLVYAEFRIRHRVTGDVRWIARRGDIMPGGRDVAERYIGVSWDITEKKFAELQDAFLASLGAALREIDDAAEVTAIAARALAGHLGAGRVGYGDIDASGTHVLIERDFTQGGMSSMAGRHALTDFAAPIIDALRAGETVRIDNVEEDPRLSSPGGTGGCLAIGVRAGLIVPLIRDGRFAGVLFAHCPEPRRWEDRDEAVMHAVAGLTWDAAQRARAEQRLRDSEDVFRAFAQAIPNQLWAADATGRLNWSNEQAYVYSGATQGVLDGDGWGSILHPDDRAIVMAAWMAAVAAGTTYEAEFRLRRRDGAYRWHIARAVPVRNASGAIVRWVGINTDIEEQRRTLADLAQLNATLEERVEARTRELRQTEEALRQAQKMEAIGQLTGGIAHDFNNLLTGIIGSLDMMQRRIVHGRIGELGRFMEAASGSAQRAAALTHRLLAFARRQPLDKRPIDVLALIQDMEELLQRTLGEQVRLRIEACDECWHAMTDPNQLESAILNLAINARDAMPEGGLLTIAAANITVAAKAPAALGEPDPGDYVSVSVSDSGIGMPAHVMERAFEPFFTTKPVGQGTGLGLSMVYGFARQSGGRARIRSTPGKGTTVTLYLPRSDKPSAQPAPAAGQAPPGAGETVLVIEDVAAVRMLIVDVLQELGYRTMEAADASEALPILDSAQPIDLLVSDVGLPGLNGRRIAEFARGKRPQLKILFVTGYAEEAANRSGFLDEGMDLMTKPFAVEALAAKVGAMMAKA